MADANRYACMLCDLFFQTNIHMSIEHRARMMICTCTIRKSIREISSISMLRNPYLCFVVGSSSNRCKTLFTAVATTPIQQNSIRSSHLDIRTNTSTIKYERTLAMSIYPQLFTRWYSHTLSVKLEMLKKWVTLFSCYRDEQG